MNRSLNRLLKKLRDFCTLSTQQRRFLYEPDTTFVRNSPLTFRRTVTLIAGLMRKSTAIELVDFFGKLQQPGVTKSAFCQRRTLIKPEFFAELFSLSAHLFYAHFPSRKTFRGLRVFAVDGTAQRLPNEAHLGRVFGFHLNQHDRVPSIRILATFDVLNRIFYRLDFHEQKTSEITTAYPNVAQLPKDAIYLYDRGFDGHGLPFLHDRHGSYYIIRRKANVSQPVVDFVESLEKERVVEIVLRDRAFRTLQGLKLKPVRNKKITVRLVRVELPTGEVEVLMTNLMHRRRFHYKRIGELYARRWAVETAFNNIKSVLQLPLFSARSQPGVGQQLWATFFNYNLNSIFAFALQKQVEKQTAHRKLSYRINRNMAAGLIKRWLPYLMCLSERRWRAKTRVLKELLCSYLEADRPRPGRPRKRKILRAQDRHLYEKNYCSTM